MQPAKKPNFLPNESEKPNSLSKLSFLSGKQTRSLNPVPLIGHQGPEKQLIGNGRVTDVTVAETET